MKLRLRLHETRQTLKLELADTDTLHDLWQRINPTAPSSVHLSLNRKDELLASSPEDSLRSLGVTSGDLIYYSLDCSAFAASINGGESSNWKLGDCETLGQQSESNQAAVHDSMGVGFAEADVVPDQAKTDLNLGVEDPAEGSDVVPDQAKTDLNLGVEDPAEGSKGENSGVEDPEPMDIEELDVELTAAESKRLSEPFFLKRILLEKSGDTSELTTLALSVHAVMLESGFVLLDHGSDKFSFSEELISSSLRYTLPELITRKDTNTIESVTVNIQSLGPVVVVYGRLGGSSVRRVVLDKRRFVPVIDLVMDTLKSDKEGSSIIYREVFMFWSMVKDGLAIPMLIGLCDKAGLEPPPCLIRLPTELKLKILELLPGVSIGNMACVCTEMRYLASDNDLWKQKYLEEAKTLGGALTGDSVYWKREFAAFWRQKKRLILLGRQRSDPRYPRCPLRRGPFDLFSPFDPRVPFGPFDRIDPRDPRSPSNPFNILPGRGFGGGSLRQSFTPRCNLESRD